MLEVEKGDASPADVDNNQEGQRKEDIAFGKEKGEADIGETEEETSSGVDRENITFDKSGNEGVDGSDDEEDEDDVPNLKSEKKKRKKRKPRSNKKPVSSTSLMSENSAKTKKKKKKKEKDEKDEKTEKNEKKKKTQKKEKKKKKKGDIKKKLVSTDDLEHDGEDDEKQGGNDQLDESKQRKGDAGKETPRSSSGKGGKKGKKNEGDNDNTNTDDFSTHTPSHASASTDDSAMNKFLMTSLRRNEKARESLEIEETYDSDDYGLWSGTVEEVPRKSESKAPSNKHKKKRKKKTVGNRRDKSEWELSVAADDSIPAYESDYSDEDVSYRDHSNGSMLSDTSDQQPSSFRSNGRSHRSLSSRSYRSIRGVSVNSASGRPESCTFRSLKEERNYSVKQSIHEGEELKDTFSVGLDKADQKPLSRVDLRRDLEAQARQHVENRSSIKHHKVEILSFLKEYTQKSIKRVSSVFEASAIDLKDIDFNDEIDSGDEERGDETGGGEKRDNKNGKNDDNNNKLTRQQKWVAFKQKATSRKGYIVIISIFVALFVIANILLIVYLAKS